MTAIISCIRFLHINRNQRKRIYIYRKRFSLRNWLTELCRLANPESAGWAGSGDLGRVSVAVQVQRPSAGEFTLVQASFALFSPLTHWMRPTPIIVCNLPYSKSASLELISSKTIPTESTRIIIDKNLGTVVQPRWHNLNHHKSTPWQLGTHFHLKPCLISK